MINANFYGIETDDNGARLIVRGETGTLVVSLTARTALLLATDLLAFVKCEMKG